MVIVNEYIDRNDIKRSNYIEKLIREDMEKKVKILIEVSNTFISL
jgi:hypothetical protein